MISHQPLGVAFYRLCNTQFHPAVLLFVIQPIIGRRPAAGIFPHDEASSYLVFFCCRFLKHSGVGGDQFLLTLVHFTKTSRRKEAGQITRQQVKFEFQAVTQHIDWI